MDTLPSAAGRVPSEFTEDIRRAVSMLLNAGCTEVYLFGSVAAGNAQPDSDIDMAVRGCPPNRFFKLLGQLMGELDHAVDLVDLDAPTGFGEHLSSGGRLLRVA